MPQEILGTSCYEYFHQDDLQPLAEKHRQGDAAMQICVSEAVGRPLTVPAAGSPLSPVLRSKERVETPCYRFKTKPGSYMSLQSQWFSFINPWTKEVEFIVSLNKVIS